MTLQKVKIKRSGHYVFAMAAIQTDELTKIFNESVVAVDDLDLEVRDGEVFGFLGPNGAGKSTTINILLNFMHPTSGEARVLGHDAHEDSIAIRERLGVLPEGATPYERLTGREHLELAKDIKGVDDDSAAILERVGIDPDDADRNAGEYSKGMAQRLGIGMALIGDPDLLILDEPSSGLDPTGMSKMRELIREEANNGTAVFFSSHLLSEVEAVCDRVGILNEGRLVAVDTIGGLREATTAETTVHVNVPEVTESMIETATEINSVTDAQINADQLTVSVRNGSKFDVLNALDDSGIDVIDFSVEESSLEDLFETYTTDDQEVRA